MSTTVNSTSFILLEERYGAHNYHPLPVVLSAGKGAVLTSVEGVHYLDMLSAYSAVFDHANERLVGALTAQASKLTLTSRAFHSDKLGPLEMKLAQRFGYDKVLVMNSGVEACESAFKIARRWGTVVKKIPNESVEVLFCRGNFWGRSIAAISSSSDPSTYSNFGPLLPGIRVIDYDSLTQLEETLASHPNIAAFMVEPIQGEAGVRTPSSGYLQGVESICKRFGVLFIADEVQTGLGRTGNWTCCSNFDVKPDVLVLGKALSNGFYPVSAVLANDPVMLVLEPGSHGSTYGGNPLGCTVASTALDIIEEENLCEASKMRGFQLFEGLQALHSKYPRFIKEVRGGMGLMCAIEMKSDCGVEAWDICLRLMAKKILCKPTHGTIIRLTPPLVISEDQIREALRTLNSTFEDLSST
jgi:ornithine--oxo-acid transaminase